MHSRSRVICCLLFLFLFSSSFLLLLVEAGEDYYKILGVPKNANKRQLKKAFHKQSLKWHPDKSKAKNAEKKFQEINRAYEVLSDDNNRATYDQFGEEGLKNGGQGGGGGGGGPQGFNQGGGFQFRQGNPGGGFGGGGGGFGFPDMFSQFFGGGGGGQHGHPHHHHHHQHHQHQHQHQHQQPPPEAPSKVIQLSDKAPGPVKPGNDSRAKKLANEDWLVNFCVPNQPACQKLESEYKKAAASLVGLVKLAAVDCSQFDALCREAGVTTHPTIKVYKAGAHAKSEEYKGDKTAKKLYDFSVGLLPSNFVAHVTPLNGQGVQQFLNSVPKTARGKAAVIYVADKLSPQYKVLCRNYAAYLKMGIAETTDATKRVELLKAIAANVNQPKGLTVFFFNDEGRIISQESYNGEFKLKLLDAFLYKQAKKVKQASGGKPTASGGNDNSLSTLSLIELEKLFVSKRSGFTLVFFPASTANSAQLIDLHRSITAVKGKYARDQKFKFVYAGAAVADVKAADKKAIDAARKYFSIPASSKSHYLLAFKAHNAKFHLFDLNEIASKSKQPLQKALDGSLEELLSGNVKFDALKHVPTKEEIQKL